MGRIQKLPESLIRLIAAGEVIERPASVMKELVENSLDAGAARITVDVWGAGRARIRISDDGEGMTSDDAALAFERHATSKLQNFDDLYSLETFGFRGEALPSIAAVSRLEVATRHASEAEGCRLKLEGGTLMSSEAAGIPRGTTIDVQDLFFNTPARAKFLKKDGTERARLVQALEELALTHPAVAFELSFDGKKTLTLSAGKTPSERVADLWGRPVMETLVALNATQGACALRGWVSKATAHEAGKSRQALFVNGRPIQHRGIQFAIYEAYREWLPIGRHPAFALFIEIDPERVDVNVHPAKREVRFSDERAMYDAVFSAIRNLFKPAAAVEPFRRDFAAPRPAAPSSTERAWASVLQAPLVCDQQPGDGLGILPAPQALPVDAPALRFLGQHQRLYLLFEDGDALLLVDQHAASERIHYEKLLAEIGHGAAQRQRLLTPFVWPVSASQAETLRAHQDDLECMGFAIEPFGANSFALKEWPAVLPQLRQAKPLLEELVEALRSERPADRTRVQHEIAARAACRAAIMAGDGVSSEEAARLLRDLAACRRPMTCPHGRPTQIRFAASELARRFGRI